MLLLKPAKIERVWVNPEVFMLRGMLSENMIDKIKNAASPMVSLFILQRGRGADELSMRGILKS